MDTASSELNIEVSGNLCTDDVITKLMNRLDAQQRQIDALQDMVNEQQKEILQLTQKQVQKEDLVDTTLNSSSQWFSEHQNDDYVPKPRSKRQLPIQGTVAFTAVLTHPLANLGVKQNVVFDRVDTNVGDAYNEHHGVFVAPVPGMYVFHTTIMTHANGLAFCPIVVNGVSNAAVYVQGSTVYNMGSQLIVTQLNKGDDVAVQVMHQSDYVYSDGNLYTTFTGFLLQDLTELNGGIVG